MADGFGLAVSTQASSSNDIQGHLPSDVAMQSPQPAAESGGSTDDPASSLRAAALLSRKRRKVATERVPGLPTRPVPEASFQLDYGQEEPSSTLESSPAVTTVPDKRPSKSTTPVLPAASDVEDGQIREEGEISDNEETSPPSPPPPHRATTSRKNVLQIQPSTQDPNPAKAPPSSTPLVKTSAPSPLEASPGDHRSYLDAGSVRTTSPEPFMFESNYILDCDHVRPGLDMTQEQYDTSKDIILDLLGWGIPPEYLVDCGLSRQIVFYVFTELNLRLPSNLDTDGLISYPTPDMVSAVPASPAYSTRSSSSAIHIPSLRSDVDGQHSLDQRLLVERGGNLASSPTNQLSPSAQPSLASRLSPAPNPNPSLHDIEQSRRQELLARKAAIASRRQKQGDRSGDQSTSRASSKDKDVDMEQHVPTETVEDFLNSIGPSSDLDKDNSTTLAARFSSPDAMDIDEPIPGLVTSGSVDFTTNPHEQVSVQSSPTFSGGAGPSRLNIPESNNDRPLASADSHGPTPLSTNSITSTFSVNLPEISSAVDTTSDTVLSEAVINYEGNPPHQTRRGTKRPVAADFVDDFGPSRSHAGSSGNGYINGTHLNPALRRKTGSFASVSGMRRCVIDLSDSEDDGDREGRREYDASGDNWERRTVSPMPSSLASRHPSRINALSTPPMTFGVIGNGAGRTPLINVASLSTSAMTGTMSPAALLEKEQEIKKMRELIAQREQNRLKKMAAMSGKSTPTSLAISTMTISSNDSIPAPIKQEEEVSSSSPDINASPSMSTATKEVSTNATGSGKSAVSPVEDMVIRDVPDRPPPESGSFLPERTDNSTSSPTAGMSNAIGKDGNSNTNGMSASATPSDDADAARAAWTSRVVEGATGAQGLTLETYSTQAVTHTQHPLHPSAVQGQQVDAADEVGASSAQIFHVSQRKEQESNSNSAMAFTTYRSPFTVYPLLLSQSSSAISSDDPSSLHKDFSSQAGLAQSENSESHSLSLYHRISTITPSVPSPSSQASSSSSTYSSSSSHISLPRVSLPDFQQLKQATLQLVLSQLTAGDTSRRVCQYEVPGGGVCRDQTCEDVHLSRIAGSSVGTMAIDVEPTDFDTATYVHDGLPPIWRARCNTKDIENALDAVRRRGSMKGFEARVREALVLLGIPVSSGTPTAT